MSQSLMQIPTFHESIGTIPAGFLVNPRRYEFAVDDDRLAGGEQVTLTVSNCGSPAEAKRILRAFLASVKRHGLTIE